MKKIISLICALCVVLSFSACSKNEVIQESTTAQTTLKAIDVDLTKMSRTMVYSEVYNMMSYPEQYIGKTIKMQGLYTDYYDEVEHKRYYACIIEDATACCQQGLELELINEDDALNLVENDRIEVIGTFNERYDGEIQYFNLTQATIECL